MKKDMTYEEEVDFFKSKTGEMVSIFKNKRKDYGPTSRETFEKFGPVSMLTRMYDKLGRLDNLMVKKQSQCVSNESIEDTLLDLANYAIITMLELHNASKDKCQDAGMIKLPSERRPVTARPIEVREKQ